jgi:hypothetical protein
MTPTFSTPNHYGIALQQDIYPNLKDTEISYRDFILFREKEFSLWQIKCEGKEVPIELASKFTQLQIGKQAIDDYLDKTVKQRSENRTIIQVPLVNSEKKVSIYEEDFKELMRLGVSDRWSLTQGQVMVRVPNRTNLSSIARLLMDAKANQAVKFLNKDKCDLTRGNLVIEKGPGKYDARKALEDKQGKTSALAGDGGLERTI